MPYARLSFERLSRSQTRAPLLHNSSIILRMKGSAPAPALPLFQFESDKFQPPPIDEIERAIRLSAHDQAGKGVDHKPKMGLDRLRPWDSSILTKRLHKNAPENCILVVRQLRKLHVYVPPPTSVSSGERLRPTWNHPLIREEEYSA